MSGRAIKQLLKKWAHPPQLRASGHRIWQSHRTVPFRRSYTGPKETPHTTYFQVPPPQPRRGRRILGTVLLSTTCFALGAIGGAWLLISDPGIEEILSLKGDIETMDEIHETGVRGIIARTVFPMSVESATDMMQSSYWMAPKAVCHTTQLPSNFPCEDAWESGQYGLFNDPNKDWYAWTLLDGHAGPKTAEMLRSVLPSMVGADLWDAGHMDQPYTSNDWRIVNSIKNAFLKVDQEIIDAASEVIREGGPLAEVVATASAAYSGSCALLALYDPAKSILRVANTGDSRAVLGRWDATTGKYIAKPMSVDHTGFNELEVARIRHNHPDEDVVDPKTGRVHGIAISRAFGDARWKMAEDLTRQAHDKFFGPAPRPNGVIKTPPYLTAEPEVTETRIQTGEHPDFLIMASDGLWDNMSSEDAVTCVHMWLKKNKFSKLQPPKSWQDIVLEAGTRSPLSSLPGAFKALGDDDETYYDQTKGSLGWKATPNHFVVEDEHCGTHLVKNALGGKRRDLFTGVMTIQPPLSRNVRDDITVHVIFFGVDTAESIKNPA